MRKDAKYLLSFGICLLVACVKPAPQVVESPDYGYKPPVRTPCVNGGDCQPGEMCSQNICVPDPNSGTGTGSTTGGGWDVPTQQDMGSGQTQDVKPPTPDTKLPGPTAADTCKQPGDYMTCGLPKSCKIDPVTKALSCVEITAAGGIGSPCADNSQCDFDLGCHFGICTHYCEVQFGGSECNGTQCVSLGHPVWGSCQGF